MTTQSYEFQVILITYTGEKYKGYVTTYGSDRSAKLRKVLFCSGANTLITIFNKKHTSELSIATRDVKCLIIRKGRFVGNTELKSS